MLLSSVGVKLGELDARFSCRHRSVISRSSMHEQFLLILVFHAAIGHLRGPEMAFAIRQANIFPLLEPILLVLNNGHRRASLSLAASITELG